MGCCNSTPDNANVADSNNSNAAPRIPPNASHNANNAAAPNEVPNQRIRAPSPLPKSPKDVSTAQPPWTRSHLQLQRQIFFETRVGGNEEVWGAIRLISESLQRGNVEEAQGIIDAAHLTVPSGRVAKGRSTRTRGADGHRIRGGIFDERGRRYDVPEWVLTDPEDLIEDGHEVGGGDGHEKDIDVDAASDTETSSRPTSQIQAAQMDKGKGKAEDIGVSVSVRVRLSDQGTDTIVQIGKKQPVKALMERLREQAGVTRCKLVFMGRPLEDGLTLEDQGWSEGKMLQAFVMSRE